MSDERFLVAEWMKAAILLDRKIMGDTPDEARAWFDAHFRLYDDLEVVDE